MLSALTGSLRWATGVGPGVTSGGRACRVARMAANRHRQPATSPIVTAAASVRTRAKGARRSAVRIADGMLARGPRTTDPPVRMAERRHVGYAAVEDRQRGRDRADRLEGDRIEHELDVADAFAGVRAQRLGERLGLAARPAASRPCAGSPWSRPAPPGRRTRTATVRSTSPGSRPTSRQASSTSARSGATPDAAVAGVVVPGVPGVGVGHRRAEHPRTLRSDHQRRSGRSRAARQQLAVAGLVPAPVEVDGARRAGGVRMIVNASSKRSMRWSNG